MGLMRYDGNTGVLPGGKLKNEFPVLQSRKCTSSHPHENSEEWNRSNREPTASTPRESETPAERMAKTGAWGLMPDWISNCI